MTMSGSISPAPSPYRHRAAMNWEIPLGLYSRYQNLRFGVQNY